MRKIALEELEKLARPYRGQISAIYLHWTAGYYDQVFTEYHINILGNGEIIVLEEDFSKRLAHTWNRNTGAIGIALCCGVGAVANHGADANFGIQPPTPEQIESLAQAVAVLAEVLELPLEDASAIMTHEEAAACDGYGPGSGDPETRWDLWYLPDYDGVRRRGGEVIRGKAAWYQNKKIM